VIAFADLAGYTRLTEEAGEEQALDVVEHFIESVGETLPDDARVIKTIGDEVMSVFPDASGATIAAAEIQTAIQELAPVAGTKIGVRIGFRPTEFTQVNFAMNRVLVSRALGLLDPQPGERVADLFCGLGNFSLPLARKGVSVIGFEGNRELVERARQNAAANGLVAQFEVVDLFKNGIAAYGPFDKLLIDPPREGAIELIKSLPEAWPRRVVYVSCDPATLARDAGVLVHTQGWHLAAAGVVNMFPHTAHVECVALFDK